MVQGTNVRYVRPRYASLPIIQYTTNTERIAFLFIVAAIYVPCFFIEDYGLALGVNPDMAFYVLSILNAATTVCRILPNWLADR